MRVELNTQEVEEAIEDFLSKNGIRVAKDSVGFDIDEDGVFDSAYAEIESVFN